MYVWMNVCRLKYNRIILLPPPMPPMYVTPSPSHTPLLLVREQVLGLVHSFHSVSFRTECTSSGQAASAFTHWNMSPALQNCVSHRTFSFRRSMAMVPTVAHTQQELKSSMLPMGKRMLCPTSTHTQVTHAGCCSWSMHRVGNKGDSYFSVWS